MNLARAVALLLMVAGLACAGHMAQRLRQAGKAVALIELPDEDHWRSREATRSPSPLRRGDGLEDSI